MFHGKQLGSSGFVPAQMKKADLVNLCMKLATDVSGTAEITAFMVAKRAPDTGDSHAPPAKLQEQQWLPLSS